MPDEYEQPEIVPEDELMRSVQKLLAELRRRRILPLVAIYCGGSIAVLSVVDDLSNHLTLPREVFDIIMALLSFGILSAIIAAWHHGAKDTQGWTRREVALHSLVGGAALLMLSMVFARQSWQQPELDPGTLSAVPFEVVSDNSDDKLFGDVLFAEMVRSITASSTLRVSPLSEGKERESTDAGARPATMLTGTIRRDGGRLRIAVHLSDARSGLQLLAETRERDTTDLQRSDRILALSLASLIVETISKHSGHTESTER